jgi:Lysophospholipase catalytic domain
MDPANQNGGALDSAAQPNQRPKLTELPVAAASFRLGVACSGGGIRSAAFNLGALQALQEDGLFDRVEYLAAVSGGNYIASAMAITAARSDDDALATSPVWSRGSPEEAHLRRHTDYLAPGLQGRLWLAVNVMYGFVLNLTPFVLSAFVAGRLGGIALRWLLGASAGEVLWNASGARSRAVGIVMLAVPATILVASLGLVLWQRLADGRNAGDDAEELRSRWGASMFGAALASLLAVTLLPTMVGLYGSGSRWVVDVVFAQGSDSFEKSGTARVAVASLWSALAMALAAVALLLSRHGRARMLMLAFAWVGALGMPGIPFVSSFEYSTAHGSRLPRDLLELVAATAAIAAMAVLVHNRRYSMHLFYRERLSSAYALERSLDDEGRPVSRTSPYAKPVRLSEVGSTITARTESLGRPLMPALVVCCAVNVSAHEAPLGRFAGSFTFEPDLSGSPLLGYYDTERIEEGGLVPGTGLTLPSMMAISGAALSPMMGRFTNPALRFLLALSNVRLGVWIPNPGAAPVEVNTTRGGVHRLVAKVRAGWYEPGAWYVLHEALGRTGRKAGSLKPARRAGLQHGRRRHTRRSVTESRFIYVSDGGHFENLGLVELLRRRCTHIICLDAGLDADRSAPDIGRAIAIARSDLGVEIYLDPRPTLESSDGYAESMIAKGTLRYPDGPPEGTLVLARAVLTDSSSWDLKAVARHDRRFPRHSTMQQIFSDEIFQAYRTLGYQAGLASVTSLNLAPVAAANGAAGTAPPPHVAGTDSSRVAADAAPTV